jgi:hypothetical protein
MLTQTFGTTSTAAPLAFETVTATGPVDATQAVD